MQHKLDYFEEKKLARKNALAYFVAASVTEKKGSVY